MRNSPAFGDFSYTLGKLSFAGEPIDDATAEFLERELGTPACSIYGSSEIGNIMANYPGASDIKVKLGSIGKPMPGISIEVQDAEGGRCAPGVIGEIKVLRRGQWMPTKDLGRVDDEGYFYHCGRADDVIISAGWTISAVQVEGVILQHPQVREVAAVGVPDPVRGNIVKAFVVAITGGGDKLAAEIQELVRARLSAHEYPRAVEFVAELPKTPAGKINRRALRVAA
jgi:acetyl-CoA synthetase